MPENLYGYDYRGEITKWSFMSGYTLKTQQYVLYEDHLEELNHVIMLKDQQIADLKAANEGMSAACAKSDEHIDKIEAENEQLRAWGEAALSNIEAMKGE